ncbi:HIT family protein [Candidatus Bathyarchaeota archaeon]|nr:HIT family protein [Candidatus Bathyarchaeota archaeon]
MCIFCKIIDGEAPAYRVYEDDLTLAFLDVNPVTDGHTLVIPKHHEARIERLPRDYYDAVWATVHRLISPIETAMDASASNIDVHNGRAAGQLIPHVHVHITPRRGPGRAIADAAQRIRPRSREYFEEIADRIREEVNR